MGVYDDFEERCRRRRNAAAIFNGRDGVHIYNDAGSKLVAALAAEVGYHPRSVKSLASIFHFQRARTDQDAAKLKGERERIKARCEDLEGLAKSAAARLESFTPFSKPSEVAEARAQLDAVQFLLGLAEEAAAALGDETGDGARLEVTADGARRFAERLRAERARIKAEVEALPAEHDASRWQSLFEQYYSVETAIGDALDCASFLTVRRRSRAVPPPVRRTYHDYTSREPGEPRYRKVERES